MELIVDRTSPNATTTLDIYLPLATSTTSTTLNLATQPVGTGSVYVEWMFVDVDGFEDVPGTLPGSTLPQLCPDLTCGGKFKGVQSGAHIFYHVEWTVPGDQSFVGDYSAVLKVHTNVEGGPDILDSNTVTFSVIPSVVFNPDEDVQLNSAGIDVTWVSANEEDGYLEWATSTSALTSTPSMATDDRGALAGRANKRSHRVSITGLPGGSTIHYNIVSGGQTTGPYSVTIPTDALLQTPDLITGKVTYQGGGVGRECNVLVRVSQLVTELSATHHSLWINGRTSATTGGYTLDITNIRQDPTNAVVNKDFNKIFQWDRADPKYSITVIARCEPTSQGTTTDQMPNLTFGGAGFEDVDVVVSSPDRPPVVSVADAQVAEGAGAATLTITADITSTSDVIVSYATADGTASSTLDYAATSTTATIAAGTTSTNISIAIVDDTLSEADETFSVILTGATNGTVSAFNGSSTVTIIDDDAVSVTRLNPTRDTDFRAIVEVVFDGLKDVATNQVTTTIAGGINGFTAHLSFDSSYIQILDVRDVTEFGGTTNFTVVTSTGDLDIDATLAGGETAITSAPAALAKILVRLVGAANTSTQFILDSLDVTIVGGAQVSEEGPVANTYRRGDADQNGAVNINDAVSTAECDVGFRNVGLGAGECHAVNAASVFHDGALGDLLNINDAIPMAEFDVGFKDEFYVDR